MIHRSLLAVLILISLVFAGAVPAQSCGGNVPAQQLAGSKKPCACCPVGARSCCDLSSQPEPKPGPDLALVNSLDAKALLTPVWVLTVSSQRLAVERPVDGRCRVVEMPAAPLVLRTCIRLI